MPSPEPLDEPSPFPPADGRRRLLARLFDLCLPIAAILAAPGGSARPLALAAAALVLCSDALFGPGRSPGKRLFSLRTVQLPSGRSPTMPRAILRNAPFALALWPAIFPVAAFARWEALAALGVALALEAAVALRPLQRELGQRRLGDLLSGTQVIDSRIALPLMTPAQVRRAPRLLAVPPVRRAQRKPQVAS